MPIPDETLRRLAEPPSPGLLQRVARELYEIEPLIQPGKYGDGEDVIAWDSPLLSDDVRKRCAHYAATIIASWQKAVLERQVAEIGRVENPGGRPLGRSGGIG